MTFCARATRGRGLPSLDARSWDHPTHPCMRAMMIHIYVLDREPAGVRSPLDGL
jgi:hypothetical protein